MANFLTKNLTKLYSAKGGGPANLIETLFSAYPLVEVKDPGTDLTWVHVAKFFNNIAGEQGWVERSNLEVVDAPTTNPDMDIKIFTQEVISVEFVFNRRPNIAPFYADADYLLALASLETGIKDASSLGPLGDRIGPYALTEAEWDAFLASGFAPPGFDPFDRASALHQVNAAAYQMHSDASALSALQAGAGVGAPDDPYLPRLGELLRCRLIGVPMTFAMQQKLKEGTGDESITQFLVSQGMPQPEVDALLNYRRKYLLTGGITGGDPLTLKGFHDKCAELLNIELTAAYELIKLHVPEAIETPSASATADWMVPARAELAAGISENDAPGRARIAAYFGATGFAGNADDPWCGAFVAWCMQQAGGEAAASLQPIRARAAAAATWREWGDVSINLKANPPVGAVVLLSPSRETDHISHVGFFKSYDDGARLVTVLGGNQSNKVCEIPFKAADVVDIRWKNTLPATGAIAIVAGSPIPAGREGIATTIVNEFAAARYGPLQQIAALANAIRESELNPVAAGDGGHSIGLFQCHMTRGEGIGHTKANLENPAYNCKVIIKAANRYGAFRDATTVEAAVDVFVRKVERPQDTAGAIKLRTKTARDLKKLLKV